MLTNAQLTTLKTDILANTNEVVVAQLAAGADNGIAVWYNQPASPDFYVWKTAISSMDIYNSVSFSGAGGFIARTQGERDCFMALCSQGTINPSLTNIRQAFSDVFSGAGQAAVDTRNALSAISKRLASNTEKLFATGTGSQASPAVTSFIGDITASDVHEAIWLP